MELKISDEAVNFTCAGPQISINWQSFLIQDSGGPRGKIFCVYRVCEDPKNKHPTPAGTIVLITDENEWKRERGTLSESGHEILWRRDRDCVPVSAPTENRLVVGSDGD